MLETGWIDDLDRRGVCAAAEVVARELVEREVLQLCLAAHYADLYSLESLAAEAASAGSGRLLPGMERTRRVGGAGTPQVAEFACAEFGVVQDMHPVAAGNLMRDAVNLRHRHPVLWTELRGCRVRAWKAREVAKLCSNLSLEQAGRVDAVTTGYLATLPWGRFLALVEAKVIEVDPAAEDARRRAAAADRFVTTGQCNEHGLKVLIAKADAGDVIWFLAMVDRIALILATDGDADPVNVRRSKAIGILANPAHALQLLEHYASTLTSPEKPHDPTAGHGPGATGDTNHADGWSADNDGGQVPHDPDLVGEGDVHPAQNDADDPSPGQRSCPVCGSDPDQAGVAVGADGVVSRRWQRNAAGFIRPDVTRIDPKRLLPPATLYIHLSEDSFTRDACGVARFEGVGPISIETARNFLRHTNVRIVPVVDLAGQRPVDGYQTPTVMAEALHLRTPADVFPHAVNTGRRKDQDHTVPYLTPDKGGPPGQTRLGNLGPMVRFHHRIKTHGRWRLKQPEPGTYLWRTPHGWVYLVDHTGTHRLGNTATARAFYEQAAPACGTGPPATGQSRASPGFELIPTDDIIDYQPHHAA